MPPSDQRENPIEPTPGAIAGIEKAFLRLTFWFVCLAVVSLGVQFILFTSAMSGVALDMPGDAAANFDRFSAVFMEVLIQSLAIVLPLTVMVGVLATFKIAGPVYRMMEFFQAVLRGEHPEECRLRKGDELQELCKLANDVTHQLRTTNSSHTSEAEQRAA